MKSTVHENKIEQLLEEITNSNFVKDKNNQEYFLESNIDGKEGKLIEQIIRKYNFQSSIEIGCAFGLSSLYICNALDPKNAHHIIIDPFQSTEWKNIGINNLKKCGVNFFTLIEKPSEKALPELLDKNRKFDFAFIDGWHTFDHTLLDFFYIDRMLKVGGVVVIDDVGIPAVKKAVQYILNYPSYKLDSYITSDVTLARSIFIKIKKVLRFVIKLIPIKLRNELFAAPLVIKHPIDTVTFIALKKIAEDERPWNWFKNF